MGFDDVLRDFIDLIIEIILAGFREQYAAIFDLIDLIQELNM